MLSIVVPAFNEEDAIEAAVRRVREVLDKAGYSASEILVVDDGSTDATGERAAGAGARVYRHPHNVGYGSALKAGILAASHDTIVTIDADLTYPAEAIPKLHDEYRKGFDMVVGSRTGHHYRGSVFRGPLRHVLKWLVEFVAGREIPDANSGLRMFSKATVVPYLNHLCNTFSFSTSQTLAYMLTGKFVSYVPIAYHERVGKTKVRLLRDALRTLQYIAQSIVYYNPIKFFIVLSGLCLLFSAVAFIAGAITGLAAPYYLGIGGVLVAMLVFCLGLLADLLRQIMVK